MCQCAVLYCFICCDLYIRCVVFIVYCFFFFFKQKTAYEMRISDWSSDVCSSDLLPAMGCSTLGRSDFMRVPFPAARITTASFGASLGALFLGLGLGLGMSGPGQSNRRRQGNDGLAEGAAIRPMRNRADCGTGRISRANQPLLPLITAPSRQRQTERK